MRRRRAFGVAQQGQYSPAPMRRKMRAMLVKGLFYEQFLNVGLGNANKANGSVNHTNHRKSSSYSAATGEQATSQPRAPDRDGSSNAYRGRKEEPMRLPGCDNDPGGLSARPASFRGLRSSVGAI